VISNIVLECWYSAYEIIKLKGYTSWAIGIMVSTLCNAILKNQHLIYALSTLAKVRCSSYSMSFVVCHCSKSKVLSYSLPSVGPGADPGVQAVSPQVTLSHPPGCRMPLLSARPAVTFPAEEHHRLPAGTLIILLGYRGTCV